MRSSNPALSENVFRNFESYGDTTVMTVTGTAIKTMIAVVLAFATAIFTWKQYDPANMGPMQGLMFGGLIVGLIAAIATMFKKTWAPITTPIYALAEGCFLGGISAIIQNNLAARGITEPIAFQACGLTFGVLAVMMTVYQTGLIKVTDKLRMGVVAATGAIALLYLVSMAMSFFGAGPIGFIHSAGPIGIGFSIFVAGLAAFNLLLDFDLIDRLAASRAPKHMEWYGAFALMVTLVWLYIEILRLLSKLNRRD